MPGLDCEIKGSGPIISNFWGHFFTFLGSNKFWRSGPDICSLIFKTPLQNVWHWSKSVIRFGLIKILTHPCRTINFDMFSWEGCKKNNWQNPDQNPDRQRLTWSLTQRLANTLSDSILTRLLTQLQTLLWKENSKNITLCNLQYRLTTMDQEIVREWTFLKLLPQIMVIWVV